MNKEANEERSKEKKQQRKKEANTERKKQIQKEERKIERKKGLIERNEETRHWEIAIKATIILDLTALSEITQKDQG